VRANQANHRASTVCHTLGISESGFYAWRKRPPSRRAIDDAALIARMRAIHEMSDGTYGAQRIQAELADIDGRIVNRKRVARLMRLAGIAGVSRRKFCVTTVRDGAARPAADLVDRDFVAEGPNRLWVADITYIPTWVGFLYLAVVLDVWSRKIVGCSMATHLKTELVVAALDTAVAQRQPQEVVLHSDHGTQYTSIAFGQRCREAGVRPSMGSVGDAYDNAMCESFFASLECELIDRRVFKSHAEARRPSSSTSKAGTTRGGAIPRSTINRQSITRRSTWRRLDPRSRPGSTKRGQLQESVLSCCVQTSREAASFGRSQASSTTSHLTATDIRAGSPGRSAFSRSRTSRVRGQLARHFRTHLVEDAQSPRHRDRPLPARQTQDDPRPYHQRMRRAGPGRQLDQLPSLAIGQSDASSGRLGHPKPLAATLT
jgi:putative transposase